MDMKKLVQRVIKYFNRTSVYSQLRSSMKFLLPHKKNIVFKLNIGGGSFTDGQLIVIGLPEYMIDKEDREIFSALKAITGHESEHVNSSDFEYTRIYLKEASDYLYQAYGINRNLGVKISDYIENAIEDGRIEKRLVNRMKGYLKHIKYFRGMWWKYQPVSGEDEYNDFVFAICTVATTGLYPKDWDEFYKGSRAEQNIEKIKPLIIKAINASTEKGCCNYCMDILREVGEYIAELIQDQNMLTNLMQMVVERDYNTSEAGQSTAPSGSTVSVHFKPEKKDDDKDQDQDQNQQQGQGGQSSKEQDDQDQQQSGQGGSQNKSSNKEEEENNEQSTDNSSSPSSKEGNEKDENGQGSGASKNEDKDEKSTSNNEDNDQSQGGSSGNENEEENKKSSGAGSDGEENQDEKSNDENGQGKGSDEQEKEDESKSSGTGSDKNEKDEENSNGAGSNGEENQEKDDQENSNSNSGKGDNEEKSEKEEQNGEGGANSEDKDKSKEEEKNSNGDGKSNENDETNEKDQDGSNLNSDDKNKENEEDQNGEGGAGSEDKDKSKEENNSNGDGKSDENDETNEKDQDGLNSKSGSDDENNNEKDENDQNGEGGAGSEDKDKSDEEENDPNGDGKSNENDETNEKDQDGLNSKSNSDDENNKSDEETNKGNSDDETKNPNEENDEDGKNGQDDKDDNIKIEHVPDEKDNSQNEDEKNVSKSEENKSSDEKQTGSNENQDNDEEGNSQDKSNENANSQNQNSQDSSDKSERNIDQYGEHEDNFSNYTTDADIVEQELDKVREEALTESQRALDNAKKEDDKEAKKKQKEEDESKASTISTDELDEIAKKYKNDETPLFQSVRFDKENIKVLPTEIEKEAKKLQKEIKEILINKKPFNSKHQRRGVLDTNALWQFGVKDYNMFQKKGVPNKSTYVFYIIKDGSGSMSEKVDDYATKWFYACKASAIIEEAIKPFVPFKVATYTAGYRDNLHYVVKDFNENNKANKCWNFYHYYKPNNGNKDGHSIRVATKELQKRAETNKVLIVLSDGLPSAYRSDEFGQADVRDAVREARKNGVTVISIAFGSEAHRKSEIETYKAMYQNGLIACDPSMITNELIKVFKKEFSK